MRPGVRSFLAVEHFSVFLLVLFIGLGADKLIDKGFYTLLLMHLHDIAQTDDDVCPQEVVVIFVSTCPELFFQLLNDALRIVRVDNRHLPDVLKILPLSDELFVIDFGHQYIENRVVFSVRIILGQIAQKDDAYVPLERVFAGEFGHELIFILGKPVHPFLSNALHFLKSGGSCPILRR